MKNTSDMPVVLLEGNPRERGRVHGETLRASIQEHIQRTRGFFADALKGDPDEAIAAFIAETKFLSAIERWTPDLLEELKGLAEGSGLDFNSALALNLADETWWYFMEKKGEFSNPTMGAENCSSLGVEAQAGHPVLVAQNLDLPAYYDGMQVLFRIKDPVTSMDAHVISMAGVLGIIGVNDRGVAMCENTLIMLQHARDGLPVVFVSRGILSQPTLEDAVAFVHRVKHASGQNYVIGSPDGVVDYECSAKKVRRFIPFEGAQMVYHTNHAFVNDDCLEIEKGPENSIARFASVERSMLAGQGAVSVEYIQQTLRSHESAPFEVCVHPSELKKGITANCMIAELSMPPRLHYTAGPPCESDFKTVTF